MANIHRIGDYQNDNNQNNNYGRPQFGGSDPRVNNAFSNQPLLGGGLNQGQMVDPRKESFFQMLKFTFCPTFTIKSFIFFITLIDYIVFLITVILTVMNYSLDPLNFLGPSWIVLTDFGAKIPYAMWKGQVWRFLTPVFLHSGLAHILMNSISQLIVGFMLESLMGPLKIALLYFVSGIGGNMFSAFCNNDNSVGASTSIFGLFGGLISLIIVNWKALDNHKEMRCCLIIMIVMVLLFSFLMSLSPGSNIDIVGHIGGLITGVLFGMIIMTRFRQQAAQSKSYESYVRTIGVILTIIWFVLFTTLFYTVREPPRTYY